MKRIAIIVLVLVGCLIHPNVAEAQKVKDAFVLVDVSGSMKYTQINSEAKQIISNMLQGNLTLSNFPGWSRVMTKGLDGNCPLISDNSSPLVSAGGKVCILPFGNMKRVEEYKFVDMSNFETSFNSRFPNTFRDAYTYITLAKAYAVNVASKNGISGMVYMIVYSDGAEESMDGRVGYSEEFRSIVDYFGTHNDSFCQKKGIIRKSYNEKQFDIEIWIMGPIPVDNTCPKCGKNPCVCPPTPVCPKCKKSPCVCPSQTNIQITKPKEGKVKSNEIKVNTEESTKLSWKNGKGKVNVKIAYSSDSGKSYMPIRKKDEKEYFSKGEKVGNMEITFHRPGKYQVKVIDSNNTDDSRFYSVSEPLINKILPFIIIVILIIGGVYLWKLLSKAKPVPSPIWGPDNDGGGNIGNNNDDWN